MERHKSTSPMLGNWDLSFLTPVNFEVEYFINEETEGVLTDTVIYFSDQHLTWLSQLKPTRVVGNLRRPPKTCHSSSESWENGDFEYVIRYAGKIRPFLNFNICITSVTIFFWPDLRRLPSQQTPNIWYALVANMLESNPFVRTIREIHLRLHQLRCIPNSHSNAALSTPLTFPSLGRFTLARSGPACPTLRSRKSRLS